MRIVIAGGTGLVGRGLIPRLLAERHEVLVLTRDRAKAQALYPASRYPRLQVVAYTPTRPGTWQHAVSCCDAVINLAGEPLLGGPGSGFGGVRWTAERRAAILNSRVLVTRHLVQATADAEPKPSVLLNASAIGYYGTSATAVFDEESGPGRDFLARVCQAWEGEAQAVTAAGTHLVILRLGMVLSADNSLVQRLTPFWSLAGSTPGSGRQWVSWIHRDDLVDLMLAALVRPAEFNGVLNATAPHPVRMGEFCTTLAHLLRKPFRSGVPSVLIRTLLGDAASIVLEGQRVVPQRAQALGFRFRYPTVQAALAEIVGPQA